MASFHSLRRNHSSIHPCTCPFIFFLLDESLKSLLIYRFPFYLFLFLTICQLNNLNCLTCRDSHRLENHTVMQFDRKTTESCSSIYSSFPCISCIWELDFEASPIQVQSLCKTLPVVCPSIRRHIGSGCRSFFAVSCP